jgi:hypothetical protein
VDALPLVGEHAGGEPEQDDVFGLVVALAARERGDDPDHGSIAHFQRQGDPLAEAK